jgi:hypothetical protein
VQQSHRFLSGSARNTITRLATVGAFFAAAMLVSAAAVVVAPAEAPPEVKAKADLVYDGKDD